MIADGELRAFRLPLRTPLATGAGTIAERTGVLLELRDDCGRRGFGEAAPLPGHSAFEAESIDRSENALRAALPLLRGRRADELWRCARSLLPQELPAARFALETAAADLAAQHCGSSLAQWLAGGPVAARIAVNALVGGDDPDAVRQTGEAAARQGYRSFKLKVGVASPPEDAKRVEALRQAVGPLARVRLDANGAWSLDTAREALRDLARFGIEYVEDPIALTGPGDVESLLALGASLGKGEGVSLAVDEGLSDPQIAAEVLGCRAADHLILKAAALGGLSSTLELAGRAAALGIRSTLTSTSTLR